jgi:hypothetical protein
VDYTLAKRRAVLLITIPTRDGVLKRVSATDKDETGKLPATKDLPSQDVVYPAISQEEIAYLKEIKHPHFNLFKPSHAVPKAVSAVQKTVSKPDSTSAGTTTTP